MNLFFRRNLEGQKGVGWYSKNSKGKNCQQKVLSQAKLSFQNEKEIKIFSKKQKLREFITTGPALQEMLKRVSQVEMKGC